MKTMDEAIVIARKYILTHVQRKGEKLGERVRETELCYPLFFGNPYYKIEFSFKDVGKRNIGYRTVKVDADKGNVIGVEVE